MKAMRSMLAVLLAVVMLLPSAIFAVSYTDAEVITEPNSIGKTVYSPNQRVEFPNGSWIESDIPFTYEDGNSFSLDTSNLGSITDCSVDGGYTIRKITDPDELSMLFDNVWYPTAAEVDLSWISAAADFDKEIVQVIVSLDSAALYQDKGLGIQLGSTVDSALYSQKQAEMQKEHNSVLAQITSLTGKKSMTTLANYFITMNGFAIEIERGYIEAIRNIDGVKYAYEAPVYDVYPDEVFNSGAEQQYTYEAWDYGYHGEGMTVAVIDTGLYITHRAFASAPVNAHFTAESIASLLDAFDFAAEERMTSFTSAYAYRSAKIPFVFDYSENDADVTHTNSVSAHGTHVAGIIAADETVNNNDAPGVTGVAPEAQLIIMKVFSSEGAYTTDIISALEDSILLGVDAINLSLGSSAGYDYEEGQTEIFNAANALGINVVVSAGNDRDSATGNSWGGYQLAINPDKGVVGSPGTYASNMTVASVNSITSYNPYGGYLYYGMNYIWADPYELDFYDAAPVAYKIRTVLGGQTIPFEVVYDNDFSAVDVADKFAIVFEMEDTPTQEIYDEAVAAGAAAMLVVPYNEDDEWAYDMEIESYEAMPAVSCMLWNYTDLERWMELNPDYERTLRIPTRYQDTVDGGEMSDFSSWGPTGDLRLKPEITAVGGSVYSTWSYNSYAISSGTSMAAPQVAGATLLVKQYLNANYPGLTASERHDVVNALLMSTASQVISNGIDCSPRNQGAGVINIAKAVSAVTYVTVDGCDKPKIELGDDPDRTGVYALSFNVVNMSDTEKTYSIDVSALSEAVMSTEIRDGKPIYVMYGEACALSPEIIGNRTITVAANSTASASVTIRLTDSDRAFFERYYANGGYVEGFVKLIDSDANGMNLSLPYMGFYGDWTALSVMDVTFGYDTLYDTPVDLDYSSVMPHMALTSINGEAHYLGNNLSVNLNPTIDPYGYFAWDDIRCYISPNGDGVCDGIEAVYTSILRNVSKVTYKITNTATGDIYYEKTFDYYTKYTLDDDGSQMPLGMDEYSMFDPWYGTDAEGNLLPDGTQVYVSIDCEMEYRGEVVTDNSLCGWGFLCNIDTVAPQIDFKVGLQGSGDYQGWQVTSEFHDAGMLSDYKVIRGSSFANGDAIEAVSTGYALPLEAGTMSGLRTFSIGKAVIYIVMTRDYAGNASAIVFDSRDGADELVQLDCASDITLPVGATLDISNTIVAEGVTLPAFQWTITDNTVAAVAANGMSATITAVAPGDATLTAGYACSTFTQTVNIHVVAAGYDVEALANVGGEITPSGITTVGYGESMTFSMTAHEGYHLTNVYVDGTAVGAVSEYTFENVVEPHSIEASFAINAYSVTFVDGLDYSVIERRTVEHGTQITPPEAPVHEGYEFTAWIGSTVITGDTVLYAFYTAIEPPVIPTYTVFFMDGVTGSVIELQIIEEGESAAAPEAPEHEHYNFLGWNGELTNITADAVIVAEYALDYTLGDADFDGDIDTVDVLIMLRGAMSIIPLSPEQMIAGDVNRDYGISTADALLIMRHALGVGLLPV